MALFENYEGRMPQLQPVLDKYGFKNFEEVKAFTNGKGVDAYSIVESTQPICFENVKWAYELGAAIAMKEGAKNAAEAAKWIGVGWCAPQQGACKLSLNVKNGVIEEALVETIGCSGMTHSAAMASEILPGKTILEALNTDLVCDAINTAMRELFLQIVYGRTQSAFSDDGLRIGAGLEDLGKGLRSMVGTMYGTREKGTRSLHGRHHVRHPREGHPLPGDDRGLRRADRPGQG